MENFRTFTFPWKILRFSSAKISDDLSFSYRPQISNFPPILPLSAHSPLFCKNYYIPLLWKIPPCFQEIHLLFTYFSCISFISVATGGNGGQLPPTLPRLGHGIRANSMSFILGGTLCSSTRILHLKILFPLLKFAFISKASLRNRLYFT